MKICITSQGKTLEAAVDPRFGRCAYFIIVDPDTLEFEAIDNSSAADAGGAGIRSGQLVSEKEVTAVLTGNAGPNAFRTLQAAGIDIYTKASGLVKDVVSQYKNGEFKPAARPSVEEHAGIRGGKE